MGSPKDLSGSMIGLGGAIIKTENDVASAFSPQALSGTGRKSYVTIIGRGESFSDIYPNKHFDVVVTCMFTHTENKACAVIYYNYLSKTAG